MKKNLLISALWCLSLAAIGQPHNTLRINQTILFSALQTGASVKQVLNASPGMLRQARLDQTPVDIFLLITDVPANTASSLWLGTGQQSESIDTSDAGLTTVTFKQAWVAAMNIMTIPITNRALPTLKPMTIELSAPRANQLSARPITGPVGVAADEKDAFIVDLCPGSTQPVQYPRGRTWAYIRPHEQTRMIVKRINPLRNSVSINIETVSLNIDPKVALSNVSGILSVEAFTPGAGGAHPPATTLTGSEVATVASLTALLAITDQLNDQLNRWRKLDCLTDEHIQEIEQEETRVKDLLKKYTNVAWLDLGLKRLATQVEAIAASKASPLKEQLLDLATYAKRDAVAKDIYALLGQLDGVSEGVTLSTPVVEVKDYPNADVLRFTLTKTNRLDSNSRALTKFYDIWVVGRVKLDFSAGLVVTGLADQTVTFTDDVVSQTLTAGGESKVTGLVVRQKVTAESRDMATLALATLGHLYWRTAWFKGGLNLGFTLGAGITTKGRPVYLAGGSLLLGRQQRVVLSGGVAVGTQKELSARYAQTSNYYYSDPADFTYVDRTRIKGFLGLTFNFGQNEKKESILAK